MKKTKVSIIMPSFNVNKYIEKSIKSVLNQTLKEIEIICVDAGSTDGTLEILQHYANEDNRLKIIISEKKSYGHQVNIGIKEAKGKYIGIVETDDFVDHQMYEELYNFAEKEDAEVVKTPFIDYVDEDISNICYFAEELNKKLPEKCFSACEHGEILAYHASVWAGIYKRKYLLNKSIRFVEAPGAGYVDVGFRYDTCTNTNKIAWLKKPLYYYRVNNNNSSTNNFNLDVMIQRWQEIKTKSTNIKDIYDNYYGPYLIFDEYLNTLKYLSSSKVTEKEAYSIYELFAFYKEETIENSPILPNYIKKNIKYFIKKPKSYYKIAQVLAVIKVPFVKVANTLFSKGTKIRGIIKKTIFIPNNKIIKKEKQ